ncbi:MAG: hypothetical protein R3C99_14780 [Pirellulaceae bacterium]
MTTTTTDFDRLTEQLQQTGVDGMLESLAEQLVAERRFHELFEVRKMQVRRRIGLSALYSDAGDDLEPSRRDQLEAGLLEACREVGLGLLAAGRIREGWMYFRPIGDKKPVREALARIEVDDENLDEIVEVALHEGVDVARGYGLVLEHYGTCNAITTYESVVPHHPRADQQAAGALLVKHLHHELSASVMADIGRQEGQTPAAASLETLVSDRDWLFTEHSYHVDTTHLASTVRIARLLDDPEPLRLALDLTHYGRHLSKQFQYQGDEPFADIYPSHAMYFQALLGENVDQAVDYFRQKAEQVDQQEFGTIAIEVYVDLLHRIGRSADAVQAFMTMIPSDARVRGIAPSLFELCKAAGSYDQLRDFCRQREDLLGFATALVCREEG